MPLSSLVLSPHNIYPTGNFHRIDCGLFEAWERETCLEMAMSFPDLAPVLQIQTAECIYDLGNSDLPRQLVIRTEVVHTKTNEPFEFTIRLGVPCAPFPFDWLQPFKNEALPRVYVRRLHAIRTARGNVRARITLDGAPSLFYHLGTILAV